MVFIAERVNCLRIHCLKIHMLMAFIVEIGNYLQIHPPTLHPS